MKGGITSGIVYPPLVLELAQRYRFRAIGGTSAGAIAAAVTAAAEFGRDQGGFVKLKAVNEWLASGTNLLELFQPSRATRPLLTLLLSIQRRGAKAPEQPGLAGVIARVMNALPAWFRMPFVVVPGALRDALPWHFWIATILGTLLGGWMDVTFAHGLTTDPTWRTFWAIVLPFMFLASYLGSTLTCITQLWRLLMREVPRQDFGICSGLGAEAASAAPALTDWLHARIQDLAGLAEHDRPLTVGQLRGKRGSDGADLGITLNMVTTSLSLGESVMLPIEGRELYFREHELARLFPASVVAHLVHAAREKTHIAPAPAGHLPLPDADQIPVLMLARMSLSFPVLLSAVPLYAPGASAGAAPRRVWFSDGGITSNFPIHFFDSWLPSRPTFGVNLTKPLNDADASRAGEVFLPGAEDTPALAVADLTSLPQFLAAIWDTTQNFHDNTLAALPGYRERIVQIPLAGDEGGLNLTMGEAAIARIIGKGDDAAERLLGFSLPHHQWVRFLSFMGQFEQRVLKMSDTIHAAGYDRLLESGVTEDFPYYRDAAWRREALERLALLRTYVASVEEREQAQVMGSGREFFALDAPKPEGVLRVTPRG